MWESAAQLWAVRGDQATVLPMEDTEVRTARENERDLQGKSHRVW